MLILVDNPDWLAGKAVYVAGPYLNLDVQRCPTDELSREPEHARVVAPPVVRGSQGRVLSVNACGLKGFTYELRRRWSFRQELCVLGGHQPERCDPLRSEMTPFTDAAAWLKRSRERIGEAITKNELALLKKGPCYTTILMVMHDITLRPVPADVLALAHELLLNEQAQVHFPDELGSILAKLQLTAQEVTP